MCATLRSSAFTGAWKMSTWSCCLKGTLTGTWKILIKSIPFRGLKNDNVPEVFNLRCLTEDGSENLPILYLKIVPLLSWGPSFNFSIWYVELHGQDDPMYTSARMKNYNALRELEIIKLCLKHFRQQGYMSAFGALQEQTNVQLEHPLISELHKCLVGRKSLVIIPGLNLKNLIGIRCCIHSTNSEISY